MNVLIIEDDLNKLKQIVDFIKGKFESVSITEKYSYHTGLKELISRSYDAILLDMSLPTFDKTPLESGGRPRKFAGNEILRQMHRKRIDIPVIIVTQFDKFGEDGDSITLAQLLEQLNKDYTGIFKGLVYYNAAFKNWKDELEALYDSILTEKIS